MNRSTNEFVGAWKLILAEERRPNGEVSLYFGQKPIGLITYEATGWMAMQEMKDPRPSFPSGYDQKRFFEFSGDRLILAPPPFQVDGELRTKRLVWERIR